MTQADFLQFLGASGFGNPKRPFPVCIIREKPDSWPAKFLISWPHTLGIYRNRKIEPAGCEREPMESHQPELDDHEDPASLSRKYNVIKRFNRNTTWVAAGLLGSVIFAALMVAFLDLRESRTSPPPKPAKALATLCETSKQSPSLTSPARTKSRLVNVGTEQADRRHRSNSCDRSVCRQACSNFAISGIRQRFWAANQ